MVIDYTDEEDEYAEEDYDSVATSRNDGNAAVSNNSPKQLQKSRSEYFNFI